MLDQALDGAILGDYFTLVSSLTVLSTWIGLFYWMRLFKTTAALIESIVVALGDISVFLLILSILLCAFGNSMTILLKTTEVSAAPIYSIFAEQFLLSFGLIDQGDFTDNSDYAGFTLFMFILSMFVS